ncbi:prolyl oligopeptidase family serine peptidase [Planctomyces sp. SH-PL14]|uniref:S9 family peptidase n=1 Tax=Planctomyces sp. SH-PL14 TaxID=1632864 RepID=UPI00078CCD89|nr:prolyl oligopeptidase family serine peptidase [Planctomyces sp. SH-PL14]AMV16314.1 Prolyl tripeptidyl peptidase precursor [Planctomyces sp. SH-PL14]
MGTLCLVISVATAILAGQSAAEDPIRPPAITVENVPVIPPELRERLEQYQAVRSAAFRGWAPDGKGMLIATRFANTTQLHRVYEPGGRREQVTFYGEPVDGRFRRGDTTELVLDVGTGGNENFQILRHDLDTGRHDRLTDGKSRNIRGPMADDGSFLLFTSNQRNGRDMDLYRLPLVEASSPELVMPVENQQWNPTDISSDGGTALLVRYVSINETYPALLDLKTGKRTDLPTPPPDKAGGKVAVSELHFAADGQSLLMATDAVGEFQRLFRYDLKTKEFRDLSKEIPWDIESVAVDPKSGQVAVTTNEDGASSLFLLKGDRLEKVEVPLGLVGSLEFSPDGKHLGLTLARAKAPADAYSLELATRALTRWTYSEVGGLNPETFIEPTRVRFPSFDERKIPAFVFTPKNASKEHPVPVLISIHGGPESQSRASFSGLDQFYLNELGIAVIYPNVRGSAGYGKTYVALDNAEKREDSVRDIGALLDWIATQPQFDSKRVIVYGGSYGGYMVLASLVHYSDRLRGGIDVVGIASFRTFLETTSAYRRDLRRAEYGDDRDPKMAAVFERIDPLNNAHRIKTALMVVHGKNDPRVPFSEAEQIAPKVRANGQTVWTLYADNEGHGFARKENRDYQVAAMTLFLKEFLLAK